MQRATRGKGPDRRTVLKDLISFALAWGLVWFLALYGVDGPMAWGLLTLAATLLGAPGVGELARKVLSPGTAGFASPSVPPESLPSLSSPSGDESL